MLQEDGPIKDDTMTAFRAELKILGGKMLRAECKVRGPKLESVKITGDFFLHPEEDLQALEKELSGIRAKRTEIDMVVQSFFKKKQTIIIGAEPKNFVAVILDALQIKGACQ